MAPKSQQAEQTQKTPKITIDGREYELDSLNEAARNQLGNLRVADQRIAQLQQEIAMLQTARGVYARTLAENLPKAE